MSDSGVLSRPSAVAEAVLDRNRPLLAASTCYAYKSPGGVDLGAYVFQPEGGVPAGGRPAMLFFFGSRWDTGLVSQFAPHALYFVSRGMTSILIDYRVRSRFPGARPQDAMADARSAVRWTRRHAPELGINPRAVIAAGASAGAHAALAAAMLFDGDDPEDDLSVSCVPDGLVLFSPILDISRRQGMVYRSFSTRRDRRQADLMRHVRRRLPPVLILHGTDDRVVPCESSRRFRRRMWWRGNKCRLIRYECQGHGFFNFNVSPRMYELTIGEVDSFLTGLRILSPAAESEVVPRLV